MRGFNDGLSRGALFILFFSKDALRWKKIFNFPIFCLDLDVDSASMQLPEENPENHWGFTALGDFTDAKIKKR